MPLVIEEKKSERKVDYAIQLILHDDPNVNGFLVIESIMLILGFPEEKAVKKTLEAHLFSSSVLGAYPFEFAEFYAEQFQARGIPVTYIKNNDV